MKLYSAEDLQIEPIIIMADDENEAISSFHWSILHGFGFWPNLNFALGERSIDSLPEQDGLKSLLEAGLQGYASISEHGWRRVPFRC